MTRIDIIDEEESFSDSSTASCITTDEVDSVIENENFVETSLRRFQEEQLDYEAALDYYRYCQYYYKHNNLIGDEHDDNDDASTLNQEDLYEEQEIKEREFRRELVASVLSYILELRKKQDSSHDKPSTDSDLNSHNIELRPKFSILKPKVDNVTPNSNSSKTPDWYLNIPDTLTPFPNLNFSESVAEQE